MARTHSTKKYTQGFLMMSPQMLLFAVFTIYPIIWVVYYSFFQSGINGSLSFVGLDNYRFVLNDPYWWSSIKETFLFSCKVVVELPLALFAALLLDRKFKGSTFYQTLFFFPNLLSTAVIAVIFYVLLNGYNGALNVVLQSLHVTSEPIEWFGGNRSIYVLMAISVWQNFGFNMTMFIVGLKNIDQQIYESAAIDGASGPQRLWYVTLPLLKPIAIIIVFNAIIGSLKEFALPYVLTGSNGLEFMMTYMYKKAFNQSGITGYGLSSAIGVNTAIMLGTLTIIVYYLNKKFNKSE